MIEIQFSLSLQRCRGKLLSAGSVLTLPTRHTYCDVRQALSELEATLANTHLGNGMAGGQLRYDIRVQLHFLLSLGVISHQSG